MQILMILIGFLALVLAWSFMFRTGLIFKLNAWLRDHVFNDQAMLFSRRRLALLLCVLGIISLFSGIESTPKSPTILPEASLQLVEEAKREFNQKHFQRAVNIGRVLTKADPSNIPAWEILARSQWSLGLVKETQTSVKVLQALDPGNAVAIRLQDRLASLPPPDSQ